MTKALENHPDKTFYSCGLSGTALRFLALRLSRETGKFTLTGEKALLSRPFHELPIFLGQLSVRAEQLPEGWCITSKGWFPQGDCIYVPTGITSQYASALLLNGWKLSRDLYFSLNKNPVSFAYFKMTLDFVRRLGMKVEGGELEYCIQKNQEIKVSSFKPKQDKSCLFALAALAALKGECLLNPWEEDSLQPDGVFPEVLDSLGVKIEKKKDSLKICGGSPLTPINLDLRSFPDLFPVLAILCSHTEGVSCLSGIKHQAFKESNRLKEIRKLLSLSGIQTEEKNNSLIIFGKKKLPAVKPFDFECATDHRMAMAAALMKKCGSPIHLIGEESVNKSFPDFLDYIGGL